MLHRLEDERIYRIIDADQTPAMVRDGLGSDWSEEHFPHLKGHLLGLKRSRRQGPGMSFKANRSRITLVGLELGDVSDPFLHFHKEMQDIMSIGKLRAVLTAYLPDLVGFENRIDIGLHLDLPTKHQVAQLCSQNNEVLDFVNTSFFLYDRGCIKVVTLPPGVDDKRQPIHVGNLGERYVRGMISPNDLPVVDRVAALLLGQALPASSRSTR